MTGLEWIALFVLLISALAMGAAVTVSNGRVARAVRRLEQIYRRQKALELELLQTQEVERRRTEVRELLRQSEDAWRAILDQLLADALPDSAPQVGPAGLLSLTAAPGPRFVVAAVDGRTLLFTTAPEALRQVGLLRKEFPVLPLDAGLHPAARVEVQAVWEYLVSLRAAGDIPTLPRQAAWYLVLQEGAQ